MDEQRLAEIEARLGAWSQTERDEHDIRGLVVEVRRLQRENRLLHASRGSLPVMVGRD